MIAASRRTFDRYELNDRITLIEGPAQDSIEKLTGEFDIIFVDANKEGYEGYVKQILDKKLLAPNGFIMCDNGKLNLVAVAPPLPLERELSLGRVCVERVKRKPEKLIWILVKFEKKI